MSIISTRKKKISKIEPKKMLEDVKKHLKDLFKKKKEIEHVFSVKFRELDRQSKELEKQKKEGKEWFDRQWKRLEALEKRLVIWWDFWKRELEISRLREKTVIGTLPSEQQKIDEQIKILNSYNVKLEKSLREGKIDAEIIAKLRKELEEWIEKEEKSKAQEKTD